MPRRRAGVRSPGRSLYGLRGHRGEVQEHRGQLAGGQTIGHGVMQLFDKGDPPFGQALDKDKFPEGPRRLQLHRHQISTQITQFEFRAGRGQLADSNVLGYLKIWIVSPDRGRLAKKPFTSTLSELRYQVQATGDQATDMHRCESFRRRRRTDFRRTSRRMRCAWASLRLNMQERCVKSGESGFAGHSGRLWSRRIRARSLSLPTTRREMAIPEGRCGAREGHARRQFSLRRGRSRER